MNDDTPIILPPDPERQNTPNLLQRRYDGLSRVGQEVVHNTLLATLAVLAASGFVVVKHSKPEVPDLEKKLVKAFETTKDGDIYALFAEYGIDLHLPENRNFFRLEDGPIGPQLAHNFGKDFATLLAIPEVKMLYKKEFEEAQENAQLKKELGSTPVKAEALEDEVPKAIPVAIPVDENSKIPVAIPVAQAVK